MHVITTKTFSRLRLFYRCTKLSQKVPRIGLPKLADYLPFLATANSARDLLDVPILRIPSYEA